jgi:isopentenyl phosphate kinase
MRKPVFLKLGGSLITDKFSPGTPKPEVINRLAQEIHTAMQQNPDLPLVLGHGSGSFGHNAASKHGTRQGVTGPEGWQGFAEVWQQARALNGIVMEALHLASIRSLAFPVSSGATTADGMVQSWDLTPMDAALSHGVIPVVYGDVVFDTVRGGTILSTEDIFRHLARHLLPQRILIAGQEPGVWGDYPSCSKLVELITPQNFNQLLPNLAGSSAEDVTGGMRSKVAEMLELVEEFPALEVFIFSGERTDTVKAALAGQLEGTCIKADEQN